LKRGVFVATPQAGSFDYGAGHPFSPKRAVDFYELCDRYGLLDPEYVTIIGPEQVPEEDLLLAATPAYLDALKRADSGRMIPDAARWGLGTPDCPIFEGLFKYAVLAVGAGSAALREILEGKARCGFNPTGGFHHAYADRAEGFCYLNDVVVLLQKLKQAGRRPAFIDIDAHNPNGVAAAFWEDPSVLVLSFHESPRTLYPFKGFVHEMGAGPGVGATVNVPLEPGADDEIFENLFEDLVPRALDIFKPDILIFEVGMDTLKGDPLAHLSLSTNAPVRAAEVLLERGLPILALGGGGYDTGKTVRGWTRVWAALTGLAPEDVFAGAVGGMMFGPETTAGTLQEPRSLVHGEMKARCMHEAERVRKTIYEEVFPALQRAVA